MLAIKKNFKLTIALKLIASLWKYVIKKNVVTGAILNNINGHGLSKSKKVDVLNIPGATSGDIVDKIGDLLEGKPESLIAHVGTYDLTNNVNLLNNVKKIVNKVKKTSPDTGLRRDKTNLEKMPADTDSRLKDFCNQKNINLILNGNIKRTSWHQNTALK